MTISERNRKAKKILVELFGHENVSIKNKKNICFITIYIPRPPGCDCTGETLNCDICKPVIINTYKIAFSSLKHSILRKEFINWIPLFPPNRLENEIKMVFKIKSCDIINFNIHKNITGTFRLGYNKKIINTYTKLVTMTKPESSPSD